MESGYHVRTTTYPNSGTRIEKYNRDGSLSHISGTAVNPMRYEYGVEQEQGVWRVYKKEIRLNNDFSDSSEWTKIYINTLGLAYKQTRSNGGVEASEYNSKGQLVREVDADGVAKLLSYNGMGELEVTVIDMNRNGQIDESGTDRITKTVRTYLATNDVNNARGVAIERNETYVWSTDNQSFFSKVASTDLSVDGLKQWQTRWDGTTEMTVRTETQVNNATHVKIFKVTNPDQTYIESQYSYGQLGSTTRKDTSDQQLNSVGYQYDAHGRVWKETDARNGTTTYLYNNADQVTQITSPKPTDSASAQVTTLVYTNMGTQVTAVYPDGNGATNEYHVNGLLKKQNGARTWPVEYSYDFAGRLKTMTTWRDASNPQITTWNYNTRGLLSQKLYPPNPTSVGDGYTYTSEGRLLSATDGRNSSSTYSYNNAGDIWIVSTNNVQSLSFGRDRLGRIVTATGGANSTTFGYNAYDQITSETHSGILGGIAVNRGFDNLNRLTNVSVTLPNGTVSSGSGYNAVSGRMEIVNNGNEQAVYSYLANGELVEQIIFKHSGNALMSIVRTFDKLNRLTGIENRVNGNLVAGFGYQYNSANQRTQMTLGDQSYWLYGYDYAGQVNSGKRHWSENDLVSGQQYEYSYDGIGNRLWAKLGGDRLGDQNRINYYTPDNLNRYALRTVPGVVDTLGEVDDAAEIVRVNWNPTWRKGKYYHAPIIIENTYKGSYAKISVETTQNTVEGFTFEKFESTILSFSIKNHCSRL